MEIFESLMEFFEISSLSGSATFVDLLNNVISIFFAVYIVAFIIRSLFLVCTIPERTSTW